MAGLGRSARLGPCLFNAAPVPGARVRVGLTKSVELGAVEVGTGERVGFDVGLAKVRAA